MAEHTNGNAQALKKLSAPARNHYFYGKLLDVMHFEMEQKYFNRKRWMLNRLGLGSGVLCGLEVVVTEDGQKVWVQPGVAIDPLGREIIVPEPYCLENPRQLTDERGRPYGEPLEGEGTVTLCLAYHECATEPVPVLVGDCETRGDCAPSTIRERYRLLVRQGTPDDRPGGLSDEACQAIFPRGEVEADFDHRLAACETLSGPCPTPENNCVVLATITLPAEPGEPLVVDSCTYRTVVYSNSALWDLVTCLAERVDACCQVRILRYVSGDAQQGDPGATLADRLVVEVIDGDGNPVAGEEVTFRVRGGGGAVNPTTRTTAANGQAATRWKLGPDPGLNTMEATIQSGAHVLFHALGTGQVVVTVPPVVTHVWPPNARAVDDDPQWTDVWLQQPRMAISFDRRMNEEQLSDQGLVSQWLRVWQLLDVGEIIVQPLEIKLLELRDEFMGQPGFTAIYGLQVEDPQQAARYLVQMRAAGGNITDLSTPPLTLDAEFYGTKLTPEQLRRIWEIDAQQIFGARDIWEALVDTGASLPKSGDGVEGGLFHGWFEAFIQQG